VSRTRRRIDDRAFSVAARRAWNRLPTELKLLRSTDLFRRDLKTVLFHSVYGTKIRIDSVMRTRSSSRGRNTSDSVTVTVTTNSQHRGHDVVDIIILQHHCYFQLLDQSELRNTELSFLNLGRPEFKNITTVYARWLGGVMVRTLDL